MSHPDPLFDPDNAYEDDMVPDMYDENYDDYNDFHDEDEEWNDEDDACVDYMDGDFDSAMRDAGFGTDEDYGYFGGEDY